MQGRRLNRPCLKPIYVRGQQVHLLDLPPEILENICTSVVDLIFNCLGIVDLNLQTKASGGYKFYGGSPFPHDVDQVMAIAKTIKGLEKPLLACLGRDTKFTSSSTSISRLPVVFGRKSCTMIQTLEVYVSIATKRHTDTVLPLMLDILCTKMPNPATFRMYDDTWSKDDLEACSE